MEILPKLLLLNCLHDMARKIWDSGVLVFRHKDYCLKVALKVLDV